MKIRSQAHEYEVLGYSSLADALAGVDRQGAVGLIDAKVLETYRAAFDRELPGFAWIPVVASEAEKSLEAAPGYFLAVIEAGLRRDGRLVVVGGGVLQDLGCFVASTLFRGIHWDLLPTTLLAQCDSCIGSKSSINVGPYKNQIGTFYPPHRVLLTSEVLDSLPTDEIRSGMGEVIKLHLIAGEKPFAQLMEWLKAFPGDASVLDRCVQSALRIKLLYIEEDEFDRGIRNILNYGHTFGHAFESATHYGIPHGIAVTLGMLVATFVSARLGLVGMTHFDELHERFRPWFEPYEKLAAAVSLKELEAAIRVDKKNSREGVNCILTRGPGWMEKMPVSLDQTLLPALGELLLRWR